MKLKFVAILLLLLTATLSSVSSADSLAQFCKTHPTAQRCL